MSLDLTINGSSINYTPGSFSLVRDITMSNVLSFRLQDAAGSNHYFNRQPVTATDSVKGLLFAGFIDTPNEDNLYPNANNEVTIACMDYRELALKRRPEYDYSGMQAGDIVVDMIDTYLTAEGVLANYAYRSDKTQSGFAAGTLSGTTATSNNGGDLELSLAGSALTTVTDTTSGWNAGTLTSVVGSNNTLILKSRTGICLAADCNGNDGNDCYLYWNIWTGSYTIQSGDQLVYKVWINGSSPEIKAAMDFTCTDGTTLETFVGGNFLHDQNNVDGLPATDLKGFADNQHYFRAIDLTPFAGKVIAAFNVAFGGTSGGHYVAYFFDNTIMNGGSTSLTIYANNGNLNASFMARDIGYANVSVTTPLVYDTPGTRVSGTTSLTSVGIVQSAIAAISSIVPTGSTLEVDTSFDGGATWQVASDRTAIAGLIPGASLSGISLTTRQVLTITGDDPIVTPVVESLAANFTPSYSATKHDVFDHADDSTSWNALGSDQGGCNIGNTLTIKGQRRNWNNNSVASQTLYGNGSPAQGTDRFRLFTSTNGAANEVHDRFDFAGNTWQDFQLDIDIQIPSDNTQSVGMVYRTTNWSFGNNTYGWVVDVVTDHIALGYGDDAGSSGTYHNKATFNPAGFALAPGSVHVLTIITSGTNHQIWLDGVKYIDITDSTFNQAGYVATHAFNNVGANTSYFFDNFGISNFLSGDYETNNISLNTLATVGDSYISWQEETIPAGCILLVQSTIDGGSTFQACTNGAEIPGLTPGVSTSGVNLRIFVSMITGSTAYTPTLDGLMVWVTSAFSSSGTRKSPVLNLGNWRAGGSSLTWDDVLPAGCTLGMDVSPDGSTWTDVTSSNGDPLPSSFFFAQPDPWLDYFEIDTHTSYTSTSYGSGSTGTWTWDTANNRLVGSGGTRAALQYSSFNRQDEFAEADFNWSDQGGLFVRMTDANHLYYLIVNDASAGSNPNTLKLFKYVSGSTQLGATQTIAFARGDYRHIRLDAQGTTISVQLDGQQILSVTDSAITGNGKAGFLCGTKIQALSLRVQPYGDNVNGGTLYTRQRLASTNPQATPQVTNVTLSVRDPEIGTGAFIANTNYAYTNTVGASWDDLAKQSTSPNPYLWYIDQNLQAHFKQQRAASAPFYVFAGADPNTSTMLASPIPVVTSPDMNYCNRITVDGGTDSVSLPPKGVKGDGFTQTWTMPGNLASVPTITLNGNPQNIGVQGVDTGKDFYWSQGSNAISQDPTEIPPGPLDGVIFSDLAIQVQVRVTLNNVNGTGIYAGTIGQTQLAAIMNSTGLTTSGIVHDYLSAPGLNTAAATALAESQLIQRGHIGSEAQNITYSTKKWGLQPGMIAPTALPQQGVVNQPFLITKTTLTAEPAVNSSDPDVIGGILYTTSVEATTGPVVGTWTLLWSKMLGVTAASIR